MRGPSATGWFTSALVCLGLQGCAELPYYWQSVSGHLQLMNSARPVDQWLADAQTPAPLKEHLVLAQRIRRFAVDELGLPDNASYHRYADLHRRAVVWNVVAAPAWSLTLNTWCFAVTGCVGYRGYFDESQARAQAALLASDGLEVSVYGVPAYSTLGWLNWAGGDPLLNTFIHYPEGELARMVFHELAHQVLYVPNDTAFNESFATTVERIGTARWMQMYASTDARSQFALLTARRAQFRALTHHARATLAVLYAGKAGKAGEEVQIAASNQQLALKAKAMQDFRDQYATLRASWINSADPPAPASVLVYDNWVAHANNAAFGAQAAYDDLVPGFEALFEREATGVSDVQVWPLFFESVKRLAQLPPDQRRRRLGR